MWLLAKALGNGSPHLAVQCVVGQVQMCLKASIAILFETAMFALIHLSHNI